MLLTCDLKLFFVGPSPFLILDKFFKGQEIHGFLQIALSVVDFDTINLSRSWVNHLVAATRKVALSEDDFTLKLLAVVTELKAA